MRRVDEIQTWDSPFGGKTKFEEKDDENNIMKLFLQINYYIY